MQSKFILVADKLESTGLPLAALKVSETRLAIGECDFQCIGNCPMEPLGRDCLWDDPDMGMFDRVEYPEFFWWRFEQIFGDSDEFLVITPEMMDEYFKEPRDKTLTRCPRCLSTDVVIGYPYIHCEHCGYNEPLIDFTVSRR